MNSRTIVIAAALVALSTPAFAASESSDVARLETAKQRLASGAQSVKPNQAARMRAEADKLQNMIDQLEAGKKVDTATVDQAIDRSQQSY